MQNELCLTCDGRGFYKRADGQVLAHEDNSIVKADLYKVQRCGTCGGSGYHPDGFSSLGFLGAIAVGLFFAYIGICQFWT